MYKFILIGLLFSAAYVASGQKLSEDPCATDKTDCKEYDGEWVRKGSLAQFRISNQRAIQRGKDRRAGNAAQLAIDATLPKIRDAKLRDAEGEFRVLVDLTEDADPLKWVASYQLQGATFFGGRDRDTGEMQERRNYRLYINQRILSALEFDNFVKSVRRSPDGIRGISCVPDADAGRECYSAENVIAAQ